MTDKQKEAIKEFDRLIKLRKNKAGEIKFDTCIVSTAQLEIVLTLIQTEQTEIKEYKKIIAQDNKEYEHMKKSLKGIISRSNAEIEKKDDKLKDIKNHIKAEIKMIDKLYNEVGWAGKEQCDGMKAAYKCLLKIYFENEVETEEK